jgi:hypothetical protein
MISIVIVNYNGKHFLDDCLYAISKQSYEDFETIIVDNASSDGSVEYLQTQYSWIKLIENNTNSGFAGGVNLGIKNAKGEYILTLNNDTIVDPDFLKMIFGCIESDSNAGICASKMLYPDGKINSAGICISRSGSAWDRGMMEDDRGQYGTIEEVFGACAGAAIYRKETLDEIGVFDEDFFLYFEDVDLAFRARLAGWKCLYTPHAKVIHLHGGTAGVGSDTAVFYGNRNILWYVLKDFPLKLLLTSLPWIIGRNIAVVPYYILKGKGIVILKAKLSALKGINSAFKKRKEIRKSGNEDIRRYINTWYKSH